MVIAVTKGMGVVERGLRELGYDVVTYGEYNYPIDVIIYSGNESTQLYYATSNVAGSARGTLLINASNKSVDEINKTLQSRLYSPLF